MCNHCPFVKLLLNQDPARPCGDHSLQKVAAEYLSRGVSTVGISSNPEEDYPQDGPAAMAELVKTEGVGFPYLYDADQSVARAWGAACTPDFFLLDADGALVYHGQWDSSRPTKYVEKAMPVDAASIRTALNALCLDDAAARTAAMPTAEQQRPALGCNIKWRQEGTPAYFKPRGVMMDSMGGLLGDA